MLTEIGIVIDRCPMMYVGASEMAYIEMFRLWQNGMMPNAGAVLDQPMKFVEMMSIIESTMEQIEDAKKRKTDQDD